MLDFVKGLSRSVMLILAGGIMILLASSEEIEFASFKYHSVPSTTGRWFLAVGGVLVIAAGVVYEIYSRKSTRRESDNIEFAEHTVAQVTVGDVFKTLDEIPGFQVEAPGSRRISILGRTAVNILSNYQRTFRESCAAGCEVRLIFVDPASEASRFLYGSQRDVYRNNLVTAAAQLGELSRRIGPRLAIRMTSDSPPFSSVHFEKGDETDSFFRVQLNFLHSRIGRDRPVFTVLRNDPWYGAFLEEFDMIWDASREFDEQHLLRFASRIAEDEIE